MDIASLPGPRPLNIFSPEAPPRQRLILVGACAGFGLLSVVASAAGWRVLWFLFVAIAYVAGGSRAALEALHGLRARRLEINLLMVLAAIVSAAMGHWAEGLVLLFLFSLSDALERLTFERTRRGITALMQLRPETAILVQADRELQVPASELRVGDIVRVRPGDRFPIDGVIVEGAGAVDQSVVTGESMPVDKQPGDRVFAGTFNVNGALLVRVLKAASESTIARIVQMVQASHAHKDRAQRLIDRLEPGYVGGVLVFSAITFLIQLGIVGNAKIALYNAMVVLVSASPCAVVLASPVAVLAAVTRAAQFGILFKGGSYLEQLSRARVFAFDKTGTLTLGQPAVDEVVPFSNHSPDELLRVAAGAERQSEHPLAQAVVRAATQRGLQIPDAEDFVSDPGLGVAARIDGAWVRVGKPALALRSGIQLESVIRERIASINARTAVLVHSEAGIRGMLTFTDKIRPETRASLRALRRLGVERFVMLTGDEQSAAQPAASTLELDEYKAGLLPEQKTAELHRLAKAHPGGVVMVGDGVNDAPALAAATVGVAMGTGGSDVALESADVVLMRSDLSALPVAVRLSRRYTQVLSQSLLLAAGVIVVLVTFALCNLLYLPIAVIFHEGSTILVILNGLRLLRDPGGEPEAEPRFTPAAIRDPA